MAPGSPGLVTGSRLDRLQPVPQLALLRWVQPRVPAAFPGWGPPTAWDGRALGQGRVGGFPWTCKDISPPCHPDREPAPAHLPQPHSERTGPGRWENRAHPNSRESNAGAFAAGRTEAPRVVKGSCAGCREKGAPSHSCSPPPSSPRAPDSDPGKGPAAVSTEMQSPPGKGGPEGEDQDPMPPGSLGRVPPGPGPGRRGADAWPLRPMGGCMLLGSWRFTQR